MSGLDKIVEEIREQAEKEAQEILSKANEYCDNYMKDMREKVGLEIETYNKKAADERALYEEKTRSGAEFTERNSILKAKQQCINECLNQAKDNICEMSDEKYFVFMEKILRANVQPGDGVMCFGQKDMDRMPEDFEFKIKKIAEEIGGTLKISSEPAGIEDGFILVYDQVEENCTLKALFDANIDKLKDIANRKLFG